MNFKLEELTKDNEAQYLEQVANLEQVVMENMEARGQSGQLFPTGREDISAYAHSKENSVLVNRIFSFATKKVTMLLNGCS